MTKLMLPALLCLLGCTNDPEDAPRGDPVDRACAECLSAADAGGCGAEERACSEVASCEEALLCVLRFDCWSRHEGPGCAERYDCPAAAADAGVLFEEMEACARSQCAQVCDYGPASM